MKWNTKQKASAIVLALAGAALFVDRFVLGYGPQSASAAAVSAETDAPAAPASPAAVRTVDPTRGPTLAQRVSALNVGDAPAGFSAESDALRPPAAWADLAREPQKAAASPTKEATDTSAAPRFTVSSVFFGKGAVPAAARVNGKVLRVGDFILGHQFVRLEQDSPAVVILRGRDGDEVRVPLTLGSNLADEGAPGSANAR